MHSSVSGSQLVDKADPLLVHLMCDQHHLLTLLDSIETLHTIDLILIKSDI